MFQSDGFFKKILNDPKNLHFQSYNKSTYKPYERKQLSFTKVINPAVKFTKGSQKLHEQ